MKKMQVGKFKWFVFNADKNPNGLFVKEICGKEAKKGDTIKDIFESYKKLASGFPDWRLRKVQNVYKYFKPNLEIPLAKITFKDINNAIAEGGTTQSIGILYSTFFDLTLHHVNGKPIGSFRKEKNKFVGGRNETGVKNTSYDNVKLRHQIISNDEAFDLLTETQGRNAQLRAELRANLIGLPEGKSYVFQPRGMNDPKLIGNLRVTVSVALSELRKKKIDFSYRYLKSKNCFLIMRSNILTRGVKTNAK